MSEGIKTQVVLRTQVYLDDPDYFCNKSWTMSFNLNTKSWISFHSYIPNWYIGENNFFYSGLNGCCDNMDAGGFKLLAGIMDKTPPSTTTTTTFYPSPSTTTTTTTLSCLMRGNIIETSCDLEGNAVITVPPTTTTTICQRPFGILTQFIFIKGYTLGSDPEVIFTSSLEDACNALPAIEYVSSPNNTDDSTIDTFNGYANTFSLELEVGNIVYYGDSLDCTLVPDGWYYAYSPLLTYIYEISAGVVVSINTCDCGTTTTTTTVVPVVPECCGILLSSIDSVSYFNKLENTINTLSIPGYTTSSGIAMTIYKFWSINTDIQEWDIALTPFSATYNRTITLPGGFTTASGIVAKNDNVLIAVDSSLSPQAVKELDITGAIATDTYMFDLQANRSAHSNPLYIQSGKLIIINRDTISSDYYISQYDYVTGTLELDMNIGSVAGTSLSECDCNIYVTDEFGHMYTIIKAYPYVLLDLGYSIDLSSIGSATQVSSCVVSPIIEDVTTTTTTTTP